MGAAHRAHRGGSREQSEAGVRALGAMTLWGRSNTSCASILVAAWLKSAIIPLQTDTEFKGTKTEPVSTCCGRRWVREMYAFDVATALEGVPLMLRPPVRTAAPSQPR